MVWVGEEVGGLDGRGAGHGEKGTGKMYGNGKNEEKRRDGK